MNNLSTDKQESTSTSSSKLNFIEELKWRGMLFDQTPEVAEYLEKGKGIAYIGVDPTSDALTIGNLAALMMALHFQRCGHQPIILAGGATGMVGDPSGRSSERNLLTEEQLHHNVAGIQKGLKKLFDFENAENSAILVNNYDWFKGMTVLNFLRDIGKHYSVNYMLAKDSVKSRMETGISFTEFSYQIIQGYDFKHLYDHYNCRLQLGGSDQWGNMTAGTELIRRCGGKEESHVITCPLITDSSGNKIGKSAGNAIWLSAERTSPYKFFQYWINTSDEDAAKLIRIFSFLTKEEIEGIEAEHALDPGRRILQMRLAKEVTTLVHSVEDYEKSVEISGILFGKGTKETLQSLSEQEILDIFEGVPQSRLDKSLLAEDIPMIDFLADHTNVYASRGEVKRALKENAIRINKEVRSSGGITQADLLKDKCILVQKGKKKYHLVIFE